MDCLLAIAVTQFTVASRTEGFLRTKRDYVPSSGCFSSMVVSTFEVVRVWVKRKKRFGDPVATAGLVNGTSEETIH